MTQVEGRGLTLEVLLLKALLKLLPILILNRVDWGKWVWPTRIWRVLALDLVFIKWQLRDSDVALPDHLELFHVNIFYFAVCRFRHYVAIVVAYLLLICLELFHLVTTADDLVCKAGALCHRMGLAEGGTLASTGKVIFCFVEILRLRLAVWGDIPSCRLLSNHKHFRATLVHQPKWRLLELNLSLIAQSVYLSDSPFLFLHLPRYFLQVHGSKGIWNCFKLEGAVQIFVSRKFYTELLLLSYGSLLECFHIVLGLHVLLQ